MTASKGAKVGEVLDTTRGEGGWNLRFIRPFNNWEMEEIQRLISLVSNKKNLLEGKGQNFLVSGQERRVYTKR